MEHPSSPQTDVPGSPAPDEGATPAGAAPSWPPWYGIVAFLAAITATLIAVGTIAAVLGTDTEGDPSTGLVVIGTLAQGVFFVGAALLFASFVAPPRPWHFGLRRIRPWPALGWAALGMLTFYVVTAIYGAIVQPDAEQEITDSLGAGDGTFGLIVAGMMVMLVAPVVEEVFFRGFFYRALRTGLPVAAAAVIDGLVFGLIHFDFAGADGLLLLPPLAFLGCIFCLVYERTKSLFPLIGMHAFNNAIAFGVQVDEGWRGWRVSLVLGSLALLACFLVPRLLPAEAPAALPPAPTTGDPQPQPG